MAAAVVAIVVRHSLPDVAGVAAALVGCNSEVGHKVPALVEEAGRRRAGEEEVAAMVGVHKIAEGGIDAVAEAHWVGYEVDARRY